MVRGERECTREKQQKSAIEIKEIIGINFEGELKFQWKEKRLCLRRHDGATTFSLTTLCIMTLSLALNVIMLSV
jgi:hypothetical protein